MKRLIDVISIKRKGNHTNQTDELDLTHIRAMLDLVSTGDLSQRISTTELGTSAQIQQLAKKINILLDHYEWGCKDTTLEFFHVPIKIQKLFMIAMKD